MANLTILEQLRQDGFTIREADGKLLVGPTARVTREVREQIAAHREELLDLLREEAYVERVQREVCWEGHERQQAKLWWENRKPTRKVEEDEG